MGLRIIIAIFLAVLVGAVFYFLTTRWASEQKQSPEGQASNAADETGPNTYCASDADCWCRNYDGTAARFLPGKTPSNCNISVSRCDKCIYQ